MPTCLTRTKVQRHRISFALCLAIRVTLASLPSVSRAQSVPIDESGWFETFWFADTLIFSIVVSAMIAVPCLWAARSLGAQALPNLTLQKRLWLAAFVSIVLFWFVLLRFFRCTGLSLETFFMQQCPCNWQGTRR